MIHQTIRLFLAAGFLLLASCNDKKSSDQVFAPEGMHRLDLSRFGKPFSIFVPDTLKSKLEITETPDGALEITVGKNFGLSIHESEADLQLKKQDLKGDDVNKLKQLITDEPNTLVWESEIVQPEFHFLHNNKAGDNVYSFEDLKSGEQTFSREAVQKMVESSRNIIIKSDKS